AAAPRVAIHPGGHHPSQRWSPEQFADVITCLTERHGAACLVLAGPGEEGLVDRICAATTDALPAGPLDVRSMAALIGACELFVGCNSGPLHIAGALGVPTVSVMGPTDPVRFAPRGPADRVVRHPLPCSPCDRGRCWHHTCLRGIEPEEVAALASGVLGALLPRTEAR
ncbi:MAG: glycosyltransferase family 9 protein, partial [Candidatus Polarisedimenticolia bacterium]